MKKSLIALAVLAGVAGTANADTTLYGRIDVNYSLYDTYYSDHSYPNHKSDISEDKWVSSIDGYGRFGIKGHESLGNGLQAIYKFEFGFDSDTRKESVHVRKGYVGFKGKSWGQLTFGTQTAAYGEVSGWWGLTTNAKDHYYLDDGFWLADNSVAYVSPNFNGLTVYASLSMDGKGITEGCEKEAGSFCAVTNRNHTDLWSVAASYENNGFAAVLGYANHVDIAQGATASVGYSNDQFAVGVNADWREDYTYKKKGNGVEINDGDDQWSVSLNGLYNITKMDSIRAAIGTKGTEFENGDSSEDNPYFISLSYRHKFSKRTMLNAGYTFEDQNVDGGDDEATTSHKLKVGVRHYF